MVKCSVSLVALQWETSAKYPLTQLYRGKNSIAAPSPTSLSLIEASSLEKRRKAAFFHDWECPAVFRL